MLLDRYHTAYVKFHIVSIFQSPKIQGKYNFWYDAILNSLKTNIFVWLD